MITKFHKATPKQNGWYWVKYKGKHGNTICPAYFTWFSSMWNGKFEWEAKTAYNSSFFIWNQQDLKFGPEIKLPK